MQAVANHHNPEDGMTTLEKLEYRALQAAKKSHSFWDAAEGFRQVLAIHQAQHRLDLRINKLLNQE